MAMSSTMDVSATAIPPARTLATLRAHSARHRSFPWPHHPNFGGIPHQRLPDPFRYGSGARQGSRDRERPEPRRSQGNTPGVRGTPSGPIEQTEWMDALDDCKIRLSSIERILRNHASQMASHGQKIKEIVNKVTQQEHDFGKARETILGICEGGK